VEQRVIKVLEQIFGNIIHTVNPIDADHVEAWDSISHMGLIIALEQEFGISIDDEKLGELLSAESIIDYLHSKGL
jgi:acyl carrier protein